MSKGFVGWYHPLRDAYTPPEDAVSWNFGNNYSDGHHASSYKYEPKWEKLVDYNPDHRREEGGLWIEDRGEDTMAVLAVRGFGALVFRVGWSSEGKHEFKGVSEFTDAEIGWRA